MRLALTVVSPATRQSADLLLDADPSTPVAELSGMLSHALGLAPSTPPLGIYVYHQLVGPGVTLGDSPVLNGSVLSIGDPEGSMRPEPSGIVEIRVLGGPGAGMVHRLNPGQADLGSGRSVAVRIGDRSVPECALRVDVDRRGTVTVMPHENVRATIDHEPITDAVEWRPGTQIAVGKTLLGLAHCELPDAALNLSQDGTGIDFNRPPRLLPPERQTKFPLPGPPAKPERRPLPILMAILPVVAGVAMAFFMHALYMLALCALSPVMVIGNHISDRRHGTKSMAQKLAEYHEHRARIEADARQALEEERIRLAEDCPDPATVISIASGPRRRLWERRHTDPDYLLLRTGTADLPSAVELTDPTQDEHRRQIRWDIPDAPVTVAMTTRGVLGVAGPDDCPRALGRWLVAQAATLHSPNDLQICVLTDSSGEASWNWARWLPHSVPALGQNCLSLVGNDAETTATRIAELLAIIGARQQALQDQNGRGVRFGRDVLVVFDGVRKLRSMPGTISILNDGPAVGVHAICLDSDERLLPAECQAVAVMEPDGTLRVQQTKHMTIRGVRPEFVHHPWCMRLARCLAPLRDVGDSESGGLPESARLLDVLDLDPPTAPAIAARWRGGGRSTLAMVGESYDGPFGIDLSKDGPHGLVAGTTGAGKSEFLQTLVASLAVANRPDEMTFVLVDYKGGSAFKDCVDLPHTVGMVTDLDTHLVERALVSLTAELTRREHILANADAKDIEDYQLLLDASRRSGDPLPSMPRLLIVIDEFASMVRDLPDFVTGLVNIAQRGRSLGIHLILATQRPSGVVSADIKANTNLRIALRVTDAAESADVIDAPDAAQIPKSTPGRAYVRLGHASLIPFQSGRVGGRSPGARQPVTQRPWLAAVDWYAAGRPEPARPAARRREEEEVTDLKVLVEKVRAAASGAGVPPQHSPWLPALPLSLLLDEPESEAVAGTIQPVPFGREDLPAMQQQRAAVLDPRTFSHLMVAGAPRSGRSQFLRTVAGSLASWNTSADLHMYGIDCGNGALLPLAALPHCGAVVQRTQPERAARLLRRLAAEIGRRQELLAGLGAADIGEQRSVAAPEERLPHIVVLLDRWEGFTTTLGETPELTDIVTKILGEGAGAGVHLIMTGDRTLIAGRIAAMCEEKLALKMAEKDDFGMIGLRPKQMPDNIPPGRCYRAGSGIEVQVALLDADASGQAQANALRTLAKQCAVRDAAVPANLRPFRVDLLPARLTFEEALQLRPAGPPADAVCTGAADSVSAADGVSPMWALAGVGGDELSALGPDLADGVPAFVVGGPGKSGRSTLLLSMARSLLLAETNLVLATPRPSPLRSLAGSPGVLHVFSGGDVPEEEFEEVMASAGDRCVVIVDDAELLTHCEAGGALSAIVNTGADRGRALVLAGDADSICTGFSGWQVDARRARRGALTAPMALPEGQLIGATLTHAMTGAAPRPGRALLHLGDGHLTTIAVPSPE
jgi:S-DNA-T family DNA segregation ATPase FtsK/SpoIIIE